LGSEIRRIAILNRGEAATRWIGRLQGKKVLAPVVADSTPANDNDDT
jgi:hypothetical protein